MADRINQNGEYQRTFIANVSHDFRSYRSFSTRRLRVSFSRRSASWEMIFKYLSCNSGGMVPSRIASTYPLMEVRGERKSWETLAIKVRWYSPFWLILSANGDLSYRIPVKSEDEMGYLAKTLNYMADMINQTVSFMGNDI